MPVPFDPPRDTAAAGRASVPGERSGRSPIERQAAARAVTDVAAMPASDVVQLALWPDTLAHWARDADVAPAVAYNMLARFKPYRRVRELLAARLDVPGFVLDHLVDAQRPLPSALRGGAADAPPDVEVPAPTPPPPIPPTLRLPAVRDGSNPVEQRAVWNVWTEIAALPASLVVQLALYPETLAQWARRRQHAAPLVYATLAGTARNPRVRDALARRLGVTAASVDVLIDAPRREPRLLQPPMLADVAPAEPAEDAPPERGAGSPRAQPPDDRQLSLGF